jgi:hypothetical protein
MTPISFVTFLNNNAITFVIWVSPTTPIPPATPVRGLCFDPFDRVVSRPVLHRRTKNTNATIKGCINMHKMKKLSYDLHCSVGTDASARKSTRAKLDSTRLN